MRRTSGFTIIEIIVVLLLMSILAATLLGRSITTGTIDLNSATDKIRNHLRYAQAQAIKTANTAFPVWGIKSASGQYWLFRGVNPDNSANEVRLPGMDYSGTSNRINTANLGVTIDGFTVFFDRVGRPYSAYTSNLSNTPLANEQQINTTAGSESRIITITPETGFVQ